MKIALLRRQVAAPGGAETTLVYLARGLAAAGHEVTAYGTQEETEARAALSAGIGYLRVPVWGGKTGRLLTYALNCHRLLATSRPQAILSLERVPGVPVYRAGDGCHREWLARRQAYLSPAAKMAQGLSPFHRVMLRLESRLFSHPALRAIIANSRQVKEEIIRHYQVAPARIRVIYNGLDHRKFQPATSGLVEKPLQNPEGERVILFCGSGFARKGLSVLIRALAGLTAIRGRLWVVGKGNPSPYQQLARRLGVATQVKFWGPQAATALFYQAATVLALPTIYDPCSNVVLESLACGTPVITTTANGAAEFIRAGVNGEILHRPDDLPALQEALALWLEQGQAPEVRTAAEDAVAHLSWEATVAQTLAVLEEAQ